MGGFSTRRDPIRTAVANEQVGLRLSLASLSRVDAAAPSPSLRCLPSRRRPPRSNTATTAPRRAELATAAALRVELATAAALPVVLVPHHRPSGCGGATGSGGRGDRPPTAAARPPASPSTGGGPERVLKFVLLREEGKPRARQVWEQGDEFRGDGEQNGDKDGDLMLLGDVLWRIVGACSPCYTALRRRRGMVSSKKRRGRSEMLLAPWPAASPIGACNRRTTSLASPCPPERQPVGYNDKLILSTSRLQFAILDLLVSRGKF
ncbi:uncharacterized protein [Aegilops tauschii subsp. strangulata]